MKRENHKRERYSLTGFVLVENVGGCVEFERKERLDRRNACKQSNVPHNA